MDNNIVDGVNLSLWRAFDAALTGIGLQAKGPLRVGQWRSKVIFNRKLYADILAEEGYNDALLSWQDKYDDSMMPPHDISTGQRFTFYEDMATPGGRRLKRALLGPSECNSASRETVAAAIHRLGGSETIDDAVAMLELGNDFFAVYGDWAVDESLNFKEILKGWYEITYSRGSFTTPDSTYY